MDLPEGSNGRARWVCLRLPDLGHVAQIGPGPFSWRGERVRGWMLPVMTKNAGNWPGLGDRKEMLKPFSAPGGFAGGMLSVFVATEAARRWRPGLVKSQDDFGFFQTGPCGPGPSTCAAPFRDGQRTEGQPGLAGDGAFGLTTGDGPALYPQQPRNSCLGAPFLPLALVFRGCDAHALAIDRDKQEFSRLSTKVTFGLIPAGQNPGGPWRHPGDHGPGRSGGLRLAKNDPV